MGTILSGQLRDAPTDKTSEETNGGGGDVSLWLVFGVGFTVLLCMCVFFPLNKQTCFLGIPSKNIR